MDTKFCSKCGRELPLDKFESGRNQCRDCRNARRKELREKNPEKHREESRKRLKDLSEWLKSMKSPCIICGESELVCIDFHHVDPNNKEFTIGKKLSLSKEKLLEEIKKCICLCSNCHRKVHSGLIDLSLYLNKSSSCPTGKSVTE